MWLVDVASRRRRFDIRASFADAARQECRASLDADAGAGLVFDQVANKKRPTDEIRRTFLKTVS